MHEEGPRPGHEESPDRPGAPPLPAYLEMPLGEFLAEVAAGHAPPAAGCVAATCVALSASLCAMTARLSGRQLSAPVAAELTAEAERLSAEGAALIRADAEAVREALTGGKPTAPSSPTAPTAPSGAAATPRAVSSGPVHSDTGAFTASAAAVGPAAAAAGGMPAEMVLVPLRILELAVQVTSLAVRLAADGNQNLRGDAMCALLLADGAAKSAAALVRMNLPGTAAGDPRLARATALLQDAARLAATASTAAGEAHPPNRP